MDRLYDLIEKFFNSISLGMYATFGIGIFIFGLFALLGWDCTIAIYISLGVGVIFFILGMLSSSSSLSSWHSRIEHTREVQRKEEDEKYIDWALKDYHRSKGRWV